MSTAARNTGSLAAMPDAQRTFEDVLVPLAERGLAKMLSDDKAVFCYKARSDSEIDPFGGIGWRMSFFPVWLGR